MTLEDIAKKLEDDEFLEINSFDNNRYITSVRVIKMPSGQGQGDIYSRLLNIHTKKYNWDNIDEEFDSRNLETLLKDVRVAAENDAELKIEKDDQWHKVAEKLPPIDKPLKIAIDGTEYDAVFKGCDYNWLIGDADETMRVRNAIWKYKSD